MDTSGPSIGTEAPVSLFFGESETLTRRAADQVIATRLASEQQDYGLVRLRGAEATAERLRQETTSVGLLSPQRVVVIEDADRLSGKVQDEMAHVVQGLPATVAVIFLAGPGDKGRSPLNAALTKAISQLGQVVDLSPGRGEHVARILMSEASRQGKRLAHFGATRLLETVGGNFDAACRELDKLLLFVGDRSEITVADVSLVAAASAEGNTFGLCDAVGLRDAGQALQRLDELLPAGSKRGAALPLIGMLGRQLRLLWQVQATRGEPEARQRLADRLPHEHNLFGATAGRDWLQRKLATQAARWTPDELAQAFVRLYETDRRLKGLTEEQVEERLAMEMLIAELCR